MHVAILILYGLTIYLSAIAYTLITGNFNLSYVVLSGPLIVSGCVTLMASLDYLWWQVSDRLRTRAAKRASAERGRVL